MGLFCPKCRSKKIYIKQEVRFVEVYDYNTGDGVESRNPNNDNFDTLRVFCGTCNETFEDIEVLKDINEEMNYRKIEPKIGA